MKPKGSLFFHKNGKVSLKRFIILFRFLLFLGTQKESKLIKKEDKRRRRRKGELQNYKITTSKDPKIHSKASRKDKKDEQ